MSASYGATRWWEYYAVRYLMPSVAGMVIVNWLCWHANHDLRVLLELPISTERIDAASLTLLFLYGNLFCYVASYPILVFHATRVMDFRDEKWPGNPLLDGYLTTGMVVLLAFLAILLPQSYRYPAAFVLAAIFTVVQILRLRLVCSTRVLVDGCTKADGLPGTVSDAYGYGYSLARKRARSTSYVDEEDEQVSTTRRILWHRDFMDTYRHLREHGNSAFIFLLELAFAALIYCILTNSGSASQQLSRVGVLCAIWTTPAVFVHLLAQHLERRFSRFEKRLRIAKEKAQTNPEIQTAGTA